MQSSGVRNALGKRWRIAPAYLFPAYLIYVASLTFCGNSSRHFGPAWAWIYTDGDPAWYGGVLLAIGLAKIACVELRLPRLDGPVLVLIWTTFVMLAYKGLRSAGTTTPLLGSSVTLAGLLAWWMSQPPAVARRPRSGA